MLGKGIKSCDKHESQFSKQSKLAQRALHELKINLVVFQNENCRNYSNILFKHQVLC